MSDPDQAALDPIFWLHHASIDRRGTNGSRRAFEPDRRVWLEQSFELFNENPNAFRSRAETTCRNGSSSKSSPTGSRSPRTVRTAPAPKRRARCSQQQRGLVPDGIVGPITCVPPSRRHNAGQAGGTTTCRQPAASSATSDIALLRNCRGLGEHRLVGGGHDRVVAQVVGASRLVRTVDPRSVEWLGPSGSSPGPRAQA